MKERIKACRSCHDHCQQHSKVPALLAPPKHLFAYDVMAFAGEQKLRFSKTLHTIRQVLDGHGIQISIGMLLGNMLHVDCSSEQKSDTVFVCYDRTSEIALVPEKVPSERQPFLVSILKKVRKRLGSPVSAMSDLGIAITKALEEVFPNAERRICHFHFLRDVGKDILGPSYDAVRLQLNESKINADLNAIERDILSVHSVLPSSAENSVKEKEPFLRHCSRRQYAEIEPLIVLRFVRLCRKARSLTGFGYPFDLPWVQYAEELYRQAADVQACLDVLQERRITPVFLKSKLPARAGPYGRGTLAYASVSVQNTARLSG